MKNVWKVICSDWRKVSHNIIALLVLVGLAVIPSLYAWFNILSNWDPYGSASTSKMQIAVWSDDEGVGIGNFDLCIGDTIVENLHANNTIGWVFTDSKEEALGGVYSGEYYAALVIPKNFTTDMISFMGGEIENPKIQYYENSKKNAIATKITSKAKSAIQQEVNASLVRTLAEGMSNVGKTLTGDDKGESTYLTLMDKLRKADDDLQLYIKLLKSFVNLTGTAGDLLQASGTLVPDMYQVAEKGSDSLDGVLESTAASTDVVNAMGLLLDLHLNNTITSLERLNSQLQKTDFTTDYSGVVDSYDTNLPDRSDSFDEASDAIGQVQNQVNRLPEELPTVSDRKDIGDIDRPGLQADTEDGSVADRVDATVDDIREEAGNLSEKVSGAVEDVAGGLGNITDRLPTSGDITIPDRSEWIGIAGEYEEILKQMKTVLDALQDIVGASKEEYQYALKQYYELQQEVESLAYHTDITTADMNGIKNNLQNETWNTIVALKDLKQSVDNSLLPDLREKTADAVVSIQEAKAALDAVEGDFDSLQTALDAYGTAVAGSKEGIGNSLGNLQSLEKALSILIRRLDALAEDERYSIIMDLLDNSTEDIAGFMTSPIVLNTVTFYEIENNGSAMAPFYTVLALWVGALLLVAMVHTEVKHRPELAGMKFYQRFLGRYALFFIVAEAQAIITALGVLFFVGIQCLHPVLFVMGCMIISFCFSLIMYSLTYGLGNIGEGAAVIILVLQVAGGGGTFPIEVLPKLYQMIYQFLPFPYALDAIRETVGGLYGNIYRNNLAILMCYSCVVAVVCLFLEKLSRPLREMLDKSKQATGVMK